MNNYYTLIFNKLSDIVYKVRRRSQPPFRPALTKLNNLEMNKWIHLAETCWHEEPHKRPTFSGLKDVLRIMNDGKYVHVTGTALARHALVWAFSFFSLFLN